MISNSSMARDFFKIILSTAITVLGLYTVISFQFDLLVPTSQFFLEHHASARMRTAYMAGCSLDDVR